MIEQAQPYNLEAEKSILACCLTNEGKIIEVVPRLKPEDFYSAEHRKIYQKMLEMADNRETIDMVTLAEKLPGASIKIVELANGYLTSDIEQHIRIVKDNSYLRKLMRITSQLHTKAQAKEYQDLSQFKNEIETQILALHSEQEKKLAGMKETVSTVLDIIENRKKGGMKGIKTYLEPLDFYLSGIQPADLLLLAARPSMGKTALGLQIGLRNAMEGKRVYIATLEMSKEQLVERMLINLTQISGTKMKIGNLTDGDWLTLVHYSGKVYNLPITIDEHTNTVAEIRANTRRLKAVEGLDLVIIDYLQLMSGNGESRVQEVSGISRGLKLLAKELDVPIIAISQLSRASEARKEKEPQLSDLRDSGSLEQDADTVLFIYREEYYKPDTDKQGIAKIIVAKQRNGPVGTVEVNYHKDTMRFYYDWVNEAQRLEECR